ncbi:MAG TPA: DUF2062 domain-containing protein [Opitutaceae bacterium]|jgi:uncharacterized protein (DUF2062 family)|nr:DUF2062 domain-containing protein [Opitutaceae bacterium]
MPSYPTKVAILPPVSVPKRTLWQRRIADPVVAQLTQGITPEKLAMTIAVGCACGLFPIFGTTTLLCFLVAIVLRLNQPIIQLLNQALWPLHVPMIFWLVQLGDFIFGVPHQRFSVHEMHLLWRNEGWARFFDKFGTIALHATAAWLLLAPLFIVLCYYSLLPVMHAIDRIHREQKAKKAAGP